ncbi:anti-sigma factor RsbA family regulatory protein [Actinacidiphila acidipaludis]|uniref:Sensor histidine kinase n=1 Tax=Actinacidiphila acidipaludis TaxID=2873382 RepID=A0ABS7PZS2_9ACTN|nr:anti-sigma factor RsbA family regulatory protein [Streptomyces acidipaludis]MBY8876358.1 sensor histidine kinase [Streptomyces acidipaludis]
MNLPGRTHPGEDDRYRHELYAYAGREQFVAGVSAFIHEALAAGAAVVVAVPREKTVVLRERIPVSEAVDYVDTSRVAHHPGRLCGAWQEWIGEHVARGRPVRGVGESPWGEVRSRVEAEELRYHEWLLNRAFSDGPAWWLLCTHDITQGGADARKLADCHPELRRGGRPTCNPGYDAHAPYPFAPLTSPRAPYEEFLYESGDLAAVRRRISIRAGLHALNADRLRELNLAATEVATNSIRHGGGRGVLRIWCESSRLVCEFRDAGHIEDPLTGRMRPPDRQRGGRGLWLAHQLCDLTEVRSAQNSGTTVRLHMELTE